MASARGRSQTNSRRRDDTLLDKVDKLSKELKDLRKGQGKGKGVKKDYVDWQCPECEYVNYESRSTCRHGCQDHSSVARSKSRRSSPKDRSPSHNRSASAVRKTGVTFATAVKGEKAEAPKEEKGAKQPDAKEADMTPEELEKKLKFTIRHLKYMETEEEESEEGKQQAAELRITKDRLTALQKEARPLQTRVQASANRTGALSKQLKTVKQRLDDCKEAVRVQELEYTKVMESLRSSQALDAELAEQVQQEQTERLNEEEKQKSNDTKDAVEAVAAGLDIETLIALQAFLAERKAKGAKETAETKKTDPINKPVQEKQATAEDQEMGIQVEQENNAKSSTKRPRIEDIQHPNTQDYAEQLEVRRVADASHQEEIEA